MPGLTLDTAENTSLWTVLGAILLALAAVWLVKAVVTKVLTVGLLLALAGLVWSQRSELTECADNVEAMIAQNLNPDMSCTFFGREVTIPGRDTLLGPGSPTTVPATPTTAPAG